MTQEIESTATATIKAAVKVAQQNSSFARFSFKQGAKKGAFATTLLAAMFMIPLEMNLALIRPKAYVRQSWQRWLIAFPLITLTGAVIGGLVARRTRHAQIESQILSEKDFDDLIAASKELAAPPEPVASEDRHVQRLNADKSNPSRTR